MSGQHKFEDMVPCLLPLLEPQRERSDRDFLLLLDALESVLVGDVFSVLRYSRCVLLSLNGHASAGMHCVCRAAYYTQVNGYRRPGRTMVNDEDGRIYADPRARPLAERLLDGVAALDEEDVVTLLTDPRLLLEVTEDLFRDPYRRRPDPDYAPPHWRRLRDGRYADEEKRESEDAIILTLRSLPGRVTPLCRNGT